MIVCVPAVEDDGLQSRVSGHFGSTPRFAIVDTESGACTSVPNLNHQHGTGPCQPLRSLAGMHIDCVLVAAIGGGALEQLERAGVRVCQTDAATVSDALAALAAGRVRDVTEIRPCGGHDHAHEHAGGAADDPARH